MPKIIVYIATILDGFVAREYDKDQFIFSVGVQIGSILFVMFLIRRWSKQWNEKFSE